MEKVRAEITSKEREDEQEMEKVVTQAPKEKKEEQDPEEKIQFKTKMGRNIYRTLFKGRASERNELFLPGRMAYVVDLEDEFADSDVPCTVIRSKADCPSLEVNLIIPYHTHPQVLSNQIAGFHLLACVCKQDGKQCGF